MPPSTRFNEITRLASEHGIVEVAGVGSFAVVKIPQKKIFHNFSKRTRIIKAYAKLKFTQAPSLKAQLTGN